MAPLVSVVMSVHNGRPYLAEAVQSILEQSHQELELILIDDASSDGSSLDLAQFARRDPRVRLLRNPENLGLTRSLNRGLAQARGEFIARQDADDVSLPYRLAKQVAALEADPELALIGTGIIEIDARGRQGALSLQPTRQAVIQRKMLFDNAFFHPSVMWRRQSFQEHGLAYDPERRYGQDYELFSRAVWRVKVSNLAEPLLLFRAHGGQVSKRAAEDQQALADQTAWRNFQAFGLGEEFTREEVALLRRLGVRVQGLSRKERRQQWTLWQRLLARLGQGLTPAERREWTQVEKVRLMLLRRSLASWPPLLPELAWLLARHPWEAVKDLTRVASGRLGGRGGR